MGIMRMAVLAVAILIGGCNEPESPASLQSNPGTPAALRSSAPTGVAAPPPDLGEPPADAERAASGIFSKVLTPGTGKVHPTPSSFVVFHYSVWSGGKLVESSLTKNKPVAYPLGRLSPKWFIEGLELMVKGERRRLWVPKELLDPARFPSAEMVVADMELLEVDPLNRETTLTPRDAKLVERFNRLYAGSHITSRNITWLGVEIQQNPCDCWIMQEIINEIKPDYIVETGTYTGGSALYYAGILEYVNPASGRVITVDIDPKVDEVSKRRLFQERVEVIRGDSVSPEVIERIAERVKGKKVLVTLDSLHTKEHVLKELNLYSSFVSLDSYLVVQDTQIQYFFPKFGPGPGEAVAEFLKTNSDFVQDRSREKLLLTYYPGGYLKRVK